MLRPSEQSAALVADLSSSGKENEASGVHSSDSDCGGEFLVLW